MNTEPYEILGVEPDCSDAELKKAWRRLSRQFHPDLHPSETEKAKAHAKFVQISAAYTSITHEREALRPRGRKPPDFHVAVLANLGDVYCGRRITIMVNMRQLCPDCKSDPMVMCRHCHGEGSRLFMGDVNKTACFKDCSYCGGHGRFRNSAHRGIDKCTACDGVGIRASVVRVTLQLPHDAPELCEVRAEGQGEELMEYEGRGDLVAFVQIPSAHAGFRREGTDLIYTSSIDLIQAAKGGPIYFKHLDGALFNVPAMEDGQVVRHDTVRIIQGLGMPLDANRTTFGNLFLDYRIEWPSRIAPDTLHDFQDCIQRWQTKRRFSETTRNCAQSFSRHNDPTRRAYKRLKTSINNPGKAI